MQSRDEYVKNMKEKLDELNAEIDVLEKKAQLEKLEMRKKYQHHIDGLKNKRDTAQAKLREIQNASEDSWESLKTGAEEVWGTAKKTFTDVREAFKEGLEGR